MRHLSGRPLLAGSADAARFVGRTAQLERLVRAVDGGLNVLVCGPPGAGATSLLHQLARRLRLAADGSRTPRHPRFVNAAGGGGRAGVRSADDLLEEVAGDLLPTVSVVGAVSAYARFARYAELPAGLVALVDNLPAPVAHEVFGRLRDEVWTVPIGWVLTCTERDRAHFLRPPADAFHDVVLDLPPLSDEDAAELVRRRLDGERLPAGDLREVVAAAAGNPRELLRLTRSVVLDGADGREVGADARRRARRRDGLSRPAAMLLDDLDSLGPSSASDEPLQARTGWTRSRLVQVFGELERAGAVVADEVPGAGAGRPRKVYRPTD